MMQKFSKDPKVRLISIEEFFEEANYLLDGYLQPWDESDKPFVGRYYKITSKYLLIIDYTFTSINYGMDLSEKLLEISVAFRDGKTEYEELDSLLDCFLKRKRKDKGVKENILQIEAVKRILDENPFSVNTPQEHKSFEDCIVDVGYKTSIEKFVGKYVVFDVETNGTRKANDDLLSISIYDPSTGKCYNRYLPLDLQPMVLTTWIHGITEKQLEGAQHITKEELDKLIEFFDLKNKTLLSFSGGSGKFDSTFVNKYCKRHNLSGFENLHFENIKEMCPTPGYGFEGKMTKDNLCTLFGIDGVNLVHSSLNDCILEWKLFEKVYEQPLFFIDQDLYKYREGYIVPVTYLNKHSELIKYANISIPFIEGKANCVFEFTLPYKALRYVKKFPTNITGISLENAINAALNAEQQNNLPFLISNKSKLEYIGTLESRMTPINIEINKDGTLKTSDSKHEEYIAEVNEVSKIIIDALKPVLDYIRADVFNYGKILSQELSISQDGKVLSLSDLSNEQSVLEIKTYDVASENGVIAQLLALQLYYESRGRKTYILSITFNQHLNKKRKMILDSVNAKIYNVVLSQIAPKPIERIWMLREDEVTILNLIKEDLSISNASIARKMNRNQNSIGKIIRRLRILRYIDKEDKSNKFSNWVLLRSPSDTTTKLVYTNRTFEIIIGNERIEENMQALRTLLFWHS